MAPSRLCPICNRPLDEREDVLRFRPFCSQRCLEVDLGRWLKGAYAIPAAEPEDDGAEGQDGDSEGGDGAQRVRH
jgi:endogenous inhibitor of DNA gyrase (YacG/DUF329 family)